MELDRSPKPRSVITGSLDDTVTTNEAERLPMERYRICLLFPCAMFARIVFLCPIHRETYPRRRNIVATEQNTIGQCVTTMRKVGLLLCVGMLAGCATSGDLAQIRQEAQQGESKLRADLLKEQAQFAALAKENDGLRAAHAKISQSVKEYLKAEEGRHVSALEQVRSAMKALE